MSTRTQQTRTDTKTRASSQADIGQASEPRIARGTHPGSIPAHGPGGMQVEPFLSKWGRRAVTVPALFLISVLYTALMPLFLLYGFIKAIATGDKAFLVIRFHTYLFLTFWFNCLGLFILQGSYLWTRFQSAEKARLTNLKVELWYIPRSIAIAERVYGMHFELHDIDSCFPGPILLLSRHASVLDTILPIKLLGQAHHMGMRIVQKAELAWHPVVDIASHRMPRAMVKRGSGNVKKQVNLMKHLCDGMGTFDALVVFPEGSRFSAKKKAHIVKKLEGSNSDAAEHARALKHLLPVRPVGTLGLMDASPEADVVFCAHTGLEGANKLEDFIKGALYKRKVQVKFWRVEAKDIPTDRDERIEWLRAQWLKVDTWIDEHRTLN